MGVDSEKTKESYRKLNEHFGVRKSDNHIFEQRDTFEQRKRAASSVSQKISNSSQVVSTTISFW